MNVAFVVRGFPSLSETFILNQITGLLDVGHDVRILALWKGTDIHVHPDVERYRLLERTHYFDMPVNRAHRVVLAVRRMASFMPKNPVRVLRSLDVFRFGLKALSLELAYLLMPFFMERRFDIIHCQYGPSGVLGAYLKELGIEGKLVTTFHGFDIRLGIGDGGRMYQRLFERGDCFLSISEYNSRHLLEFGADPGKVVHHPVGVDTVLYSPPDFRGDDGITRILTVARLVEEKGLDTGIQAVRRLLDRLPGTPVEYRIVGDGPLRGELGVLAQDLRLNERVRFLGPMVQEDVMREMRASDIFLLPSKHEALPVVLMEAQATGLPVVATDVGSVRELVLEEESGFVVPPGDTDALADRLTFLVKHPELRSRMGGRGRVHIQEHYNIKLLTKRLVVIYKRLLDGAERLKEGEAA